MKINKRIDRIRSFKAVFLALFAVLLLFAVSESVLRNFTSFGNTLNTLEYYASLSFSEEDLKTAIKAREDLASIGDKIIGVPGTLIYRYKKARTESFNFNSFGFRGEEPQKKEENEYRIGVFGDSRIIGIYLAEENTIPFILQKRLRDEFPDRKFTVFNIGIEGNELQREISFAELDSVNLELDMAVFYAGANDVNYSFERGNADYQPFTEKDKLYQNLIENLAENKKKPFLQRSALIKVIKESFSSDFIHNFAPSKKEEVFAPLIPEFEARADEFIRKYKARIDKASAAMTAKGIKSVFFFPPFLQLKEPLSEIERNMLYKNEMTLPGANSYVIHCANGFSESENPVLFLQTTVFNGHPETMFYDSVHFTPEGSRIAGNNMADRIIPLLKEYFKQ